MLHLPVHPPCETRLPSRSDPMLSSGLWLETVTVHHHWFVINHAALPKHPALAKKAGSMCEQFVIRDCDGSGITLAGLLFRTCGVSMGAATSEAPFPKTSALDSHGFPNDVSGQRDHPIEVMVGQLVVEGKSDQTLRHGIGHR